MDYAGLKKSGESIERETICTIPDPYSELQMLLLFAFQHPRWQISLAQFKIFSMLTELVYIFFFVFPLPSPSHLRPFHLMSIYRVTMENELTGWMTLYMYRVRDSTSVCNLVGVQSVASLIKSHYSSPGFSIIVLISLLCLLLYHSMGRYSDYLYCSIFNNKNQLLKFCSVKIAKGGKAYPSWTLTDSPSHLDSNRTSRGSVQVI